MDILKAPRDAVLEPLQSIYKIADHRSNLTILGNILIGLDGLTTKFVAGDGEMQITATTDMNHGKEFAGTTVDARKIHDILRALPPDAVVKLSHAKDRLTVQGGKSRFSMQTKPSAEFPMMASDRSDPVVVSMRQRELLSLINLTFYAMASQDVRYYLNGLLIDLDNGLVTAVATDGHRLACASVAVSCAPAARQMILPAKTVTELRGLLEDSDKDVTLAIGERYARLTFGKMELVSKLIEGKFPDYRRILPTDLSNEVTVNRITLLQALMRVAIVMSGKCRGVTCNFTPGMLAIDGRNEEAEEGAEEIEINYGGAGTAIFFNVDLLTQALSKLQCETVRIVIAGVQSSVLLRAGDVDTFRYVVMPMR